MTKLETAKKRKWFLFTVVYFMIGYLGLGNLNMFRDHYFNVELPFEASIPFVPAFILGYTSVYFALILVYVLIDDYKLFDRAIKFFLTVSTVHFILFMLVPVKMTRPDLASAAGTMDILTKYYFNYPRSEERFAGKFLELFFKLTKRFLSIVSIVKYRPCLVQQP